MYIKEFLSCNFPKDCDLDKWKKYNVNYVLLVIYEKVIT